MTNLEMSVLTRLALLKASDNVNGRFAKAEQQLSGKALRVAKAIRKGDRDNPISKSLLEWADHELGVGV